MTHTPLLGRVLAEACTEPLVSYGKKALEDCRNNVSSKNIEQIALDIIITTGLVSNFTVHQNNPDPKDDYYYNSSLAHCVYYGASLFPKCEHDHLHGEIVSFGVLCLLTYDEQFEERQRIFEFNRSIGLPCTLGEIALTEEDVPAIAHKAASVVEWTYVPGEPTEEKFIKAILDTVRQERNFLQREYKRLSFNNINKNDALVIRSRHHFFYAMLIRYKLIEKLYSKSVCHSCNEIYYCLCIDQICF